EIMAVRIEDKGAEIVRMIMATDPGRAIVAAARSQRGRVECAHRVLSIGGEGEMDRPGRRAEAEPELGLVGRAHQGPALALADDADPERRQGRDIESFGLREVFDGEPDVID